MGLTVIAPPSLGLIVQQQDPCGGRGRVGPFTQAGDQRQAPRMPRRGRHSIKTGEIRGKNFGASNGVAIEGEPDDSPRIDAVLNAQQAVAVQIEAIDPAQKSRLLGKSRNKGPVELKNCDPQGVRHKHPAARGVEHNTVGIIEAFVRKS